MLKHEMAKKEINFSIIKMKEEHIPQIAAIEAEAFSMPWSQQAFADALALDYAEFYEALADGKSVGYCGVYFAADEGEITNIAVAPAYRRQRIAEALLQKVLQKARELSVKRIFLEVRGSNLPAQRLYQKAGFAEAGRRKNFYQYPPEDALVMVYESADI